MEVSIYVILVNLIALAHADVSHYNPCESHSGVAFEADPTDCHRYYWCLGKGLSHRLSCGDLTVWSPEKRNCVHKFSVHDKCTPQLERPTAKTPAIEVFKNSIADLIRETKKTLIRGVENMPKSVAQNIIRSRQRNQQQRTFTRKRGPDYATNGRPLDSVSNNLHSFSNNQQWPTDLVPSTTPHHTFEPLRCPPGSHEKFPHPTECGQFYDCAAPTSEDIWGKHLRECTYPKVFDDYSRRCVHFKRNVCGSRRVPIDPCDYLANQCRTAHCVPCRVRFATCSHMSDGLNPWRGRENSPFFVFCKDQRVEFHGRCLWPHGPPLIFDPLERKCIEANV